MWFLMKLKSFYEAQQLNESLILELFRKADEIRNNPQSFSSALNGKILATLFYEPSTRTRLSFESAMLRLGGSVLSTENAKEFSSAVKGESMEDTARIVGAYSDCIVIRHYEEGTSKRAVSVSPVPIINAGDGKGQHPTQALLDAYTIFREVGKLDGLKVAMVGDLASGRTVRSLCYLLGKYKNNEIIFVSPENLKIKDDIKEYLTKHNTKWREETNFASVLPIADIVYVTRIQKERISPEEYERAKGKYIITEKELALVRPNARIMHPLPHVEELSLPIEIEQTDKRIAYFRQAENGLYVRMALLLEIINSN
jgi:aspartate carbamoyltransferase catalytic subunit